ncbi:hypothetical protein C3747_21g57 [Trypanosoma cruzi]|uniref:Uncharacterized protein n=2 Tax=Trypanosoma cruzi TaxID=5693 RepID=Q4DQY1_TRYCC|nr:hypothetical protein, conserved [Trypanosoma cruzi]EAN94927.1 hypothetical protein, conserved [Trypanosoma cruzi]PWV16785.1 hypothetical protein C3747_21g57 [Trypanosoma cruzi]RNC46644.1 hypothetical protein TcCL_NonESM03511 [Trypanosoma cruzi]|eukprot:XP_816778.1 hypothetical protein [Trypanosoma cruzi strain CL Brener]
MMLHTVSRCCGYCALLGVTLLVVASMITRPAAGATMSDTVAASIVDVAKGGLMLSRYASEKVLHAVPPTLRPHVRQFLAGATAVALVGHGLGSMPGVLDADTDASLSSEEASGKSAQMTRFFTAVTAHPVEKFFYALGGIFVELLLLRLLVSPPRLTSFVEAMRGSKDKTRKTLTRRLFSTHVGWGLLVLCIATPNGVIEAGLIVAMLIRLPLETYAPALVIGKLAQPYFAAVLHELPFVRRVMQKTFWFSAKDEKTPFASLLPLYKTAIEVALWVAVVAALLLLVARFMCADATIEVDEDEKIVISDLMNEDGESDEE